MNIVRYTNTTFAKLFFPATRLGIVIYVGGIGTKFMNIRNSNGKHCYSPINYLFDCGKFPFLLCNITIMFDAV